MEWCEMMTKLLMKWWSGGKLLMKWWRNYWWSGGKMIDEVVAKWLMKWWRSDWWSGGELIDGMVWNGGEIVRVKWMERLLVKTNGKKTNKNCFSVNPNINNNKLIERIF